MRSIRNVILALTVGTLLIVVLAACVFQTPPVPEEPAGAGGSVVRDFNVPGVLTARQANFPGSMTAGSASVGSLNVRGNLTLGPDSLPFYYPLNLSGSIAGNATLTDTVSAVLVPADVTVGSINYFASEISGTVGCNVFYTTTGITPTMQSIADNVNLTAGTVVTDIVQYGALEAGYLLELACQSEAGGYAYDVMATLWLK
jgi:hypothetical protein